MLLARFWKNAAGGVAPMLALTIVPLLAAVGAAVDYSRANAARTAFQTALDSTALMLSKTAATNHRRATEHRRDQYLQRRVPPPRRPGRDGHRQLFADRRLEGRRSPASGTSPTDFLSFLGYSTIPISATSTSTWGNTRLRVALVLDNTGSMAHDDKMTALKTASQNLLAQLQERGQQARRRLCLDHPLQQGRQRRRQQ